MAGNGEIGGGNMDGNNAGHPQGTEYTLQGWLADVYSHWILGFRFSEYPATVMVMSMLMCRIFLIQGSCDSSNPSGTDTSGTAMPGRSRGRR